MALYGSQPAAVSVLIEISAATVLVSMPEMSKCDDWPMIAVTLKATTTNKETIPLKPFIRFS